MNLFVKDLPPDVQMLIALGAAVAAGCRPCLERLVPLAKSEAVEAPQIRAALTIGRFVRDYPIKEMDQLVDELAGIDTAKTAESINCPLSASSPVEAPCC